ncbi:MAG: thioredoxin [Methanothrix sp.]|nr:thioredoxin [Methanothrix sp.]MCX8206984.1 thioredoxin [Methanothrix sp.]
MTSFEEVEDLDKPVLIDFFATWCGPCRMQTPIMEELEKKYSGRIEIKKVDVDSNMELANRYNIMVVPTIVLEKDGKEVRRWLGVTPKEELSNAIDELL